MLWVTDGVTFQILEGHASSWPPFRDPGRDKARPSKESPRQ
jgi:hypothetical protein